MRPLWVKLQGENKPLSAGTEHELLCEVVGSRPSKYTEYINSNTLIKTFAFKAQLLLGGKVAS